MAQEMTQQPLLNEQNQPTQPATYYVPQPGQPMPPQQNYNNVPYQQMMPPQNITVTTVNEVHPNQSLCAMLCCVFGCCFCPLWLIPICCCRHSQDTNARYWANCSCGWFLVAAIIDGLAIGIVLLLIALGVIVVS